MSDIVQFAVPPEIPYRLEDRLSVFDDVGTLRMLVRSLWDIVADIDMYSNLEEADNAKFRNLAERRQKDRWKLPIITDGYTLYIKKEE